MIDCFCDYDPAHVYVASAPTARKRHRCYDCGGFVEPGEKHEKVFAVWERGDSPDTVRTCPRCLDLRTWVQNNVPCFCYMHGGLFETAKDAIEAAYDRARDEVTGLRFGYLRRRILLNKHNAAARAA